MKDVLMSIRPEYAAMIYARTKTVEFRRRLPESARQWRRFYIYESSPVRKVTGMVALATVKQGDVDWIWRMFKNDGGISWSFYSEYMIGAKAAWALVIARTYPFAEPLPLSSFGVGRAPQSWIYLYH